MNELKAAGASDILGYLFPVTFLAVALWEARRPSRPATTPMTLRWVGNVGLFGLAWLAGRMLPLLTGYGAAVLAAHRGWGLFNAVAVPAAVALALGFVALDVTAYWTHRLFHGFSLLWRLHAIHHADTDLDVTTTVRHHPLEVFVQALFDGSIAILLGIPPQAVALYGGCVLIVQTFNHGNVVLPRRLRWISSVLMTPDLHRLHHSMASAEYNSNFGNLVPLWDRLFGTLRRHPEGELRMGIAGFAGAGFQRFDKLLILPVLIGAARSGPPPGPAARASVHTPQG